VDREIVVRGEGEARALPDRAVLRATVDGEGSTQTEAYEAAARWAAAVDEVVAAAGDVVARATTSALVVQPRAKWHKGEAVRTGWQAARTTVVEVAALTEVGALVGRLVTAGAAVSGPDWELAPDHAAHDEARRRAATDARRRAEAYAGALGLALGPVAWVAEPGLRSGTGGPGFAPMAAFRMAKGDAGGDVEIAVHPEEITITAAVEVAFTIG
jgi:uncharacterized protein YggE